MCKPINCLNKMCFFKISMSCVVGLKFQNALSLWFLIGRLSYFFVMTVTCNLILWHFPKLDMEKSFFKEKGSDVFVYPHQMLQTWVKLKCHFSSFVFWFFFPINLSRKPRVIYMRRISNKWYTHLWFRSNSSVWNLTAILKSTFFFPARCLNIC